MKEFFKTVDVDGHNDVEEVQIFFTALPLSNEIPRIFFVVTIFRK